MIVEPFLNDIQLLRVGIGMATLAASAGWGAMRAKLGKYPVVTLLKKIYNRED